MLEAPDPAAAIIDFATRNGADHIVMGARASSALRRYLGSVSAQVVAESPCTVTVVRGPNAPRLKISSGRVLRRAAALRRDLRVDDQGIARRRHLR